MATRILHCGKNTENYDICLKDKIAGFTMRVAEEGDLVYFALRLDKERKTVSGARGVLDAPTDKKPWDDAERYVQCFTVKDMQFCDPIDLSELKTVVGKLWSIKYMQSPKPIREEESCELLDSLFNENRVNQPIYFTEEKEKDTSEYVEDEENHITGEAALKSDTTTCSNTVAWEDEKEAEEEIQEDAINIMGTFQTIKFKNETDQIQGLEPLVNKNFYNLFKNISEERSIFIPENRLFKTSGVQNKLNENIKQVSGIPDALLLIFHPEDAVPIQVNLIEYECYGENKLKSIDKFRYLNGHIIPQLMRFASSFSIVTDREIRRRTIEDWNNKIIELVYNDENIKQRITEWMDTLYHRNMPETVFRDFEKCLVESFQNNIRIMLVIDEFTSEQKDTLTNIINSFRMENDTGVGFVGYIVRLHQKIDIFSPEEEFALSIE